jgi:hypothetical protein
MWLLIYTVFVDIFHQSAFHNDFAANKTNTKIPKKCFAAMLSLGMVSVN